MSKCVHRSQGNLTFMPAHASLQPVTLLQHNTQQSVPHLDSTYLCASQQQRDTRQQEGIGHLHSKKRRGDYTLFLSVHAYMLTAQSNVGKVSADPRKAPAHWFAFLPLSRPKSVKTRTHPALPDLTCSSCQGLVNEGRATTMLMWMAAHVSLWYLGCKCVLV